MNREQARALADQLWKVADSTGLGRSVYMVLDGAKSTKIYPMINNSGLESTCLFSGSLSYSLTRAAPHLVKLTKESDFLVHILEVSGGEAWGVILFADAQTDTSNVRNHCRRIANVTGVNGKSLYFRYYDPSISQSLLPVCSIDELTTLFGPIQYFITMINSGDADWQWSAMYRSIEGDGQLETQLMKESEPLSAATPFKSFSYIRPFQLRQAHMDVFEKKADLSFFKKIMQTYTKCYEPNPNLTFKIDNTPYNLAGYLWRCYPKGVEYKLESAYDFSVFFHLCRSYGWAFWEKEKYKWVTDLLNLPRPSEVRISKIERELSNQLVKRIWS